MQLRAWEEKDIPVIAEMEKRCFPKDPWTERMLFDALNTSYMWNVLVEEGGQVCGYACIGCLFETADLMNIAVDFPFRGRGVASALMDALHAKARELGAERMMLEVHVANAPAIALYQKYGYEKIAARKNYYGDGEDADIMQFVF